MSKTFKQYLDEIKAQERNSQAKIESTKQEW